MAVHLIYLEESLHGLLYARCTFIHKDHRKLVRYNPIFIWPFKLFVAYFDLGNLRLNFHTGIIIGFLSIAWCGHLVHVAIPITYKFHLGVLSEHTVALDKWSISLYPFYIEYDFTLSYRYSPSSLRCWDSICLAIEYVMSSLSMVILVQ